MAASDPIESARLRRWLEREHRTRLEAETIAERALLDLYERQREVEFLQRISTAANEATSVEAAIQRALDEVCAYTGWPIGHAYLATTDRPQDLVPTTLWHLDEPERFVTFRTVTEATRFPPGIGLPGRVFLEQKPAWIVDVRNDDNFPRAKAAHDIQVRGAFGFPLMIGDEVVGVLEFFSDVTRQSDEAILKIMRHVGVQLGRVIERARAGEALRRSQAQLLQAQKMEAVGRLAGGVAHDFNNILGVILGYGEMALNELAATHPAQARVRETIRAAERAATLTRQLLAFSRKQVFEPRVFDLNALLVDMDRMLRRLIGEDIELITLAAPQLSPVKADPGQIEQVLMNLVVNARDAMPRGGRVTIETADIVLDEECSRQHVSMEPGHYVMLAVTDTGVGMTAEVQARIFEPFFTTKEPGKGTGLGLATAYGIIKQSGGWIWVSSRCGHGTTFKIYLRRVEGAPERLASGDVGSVPRGSETVLVVEDEPPVRELVRESLEWLGYHVLVACAADEAEQTARGGHPIDLLITDVVLPGYGGREVAKRLCGLNPGLKVLYMSGYTDDAIVRQGDLESGAALLQKPFGVAALALRVRQVLDGPERKPAFRS